MPGQDLIMPGMQCSLEKMRLSPSPLFGEVTDENGVVNTTWSTSTERGSSGVEMRQAFIFQRLHVRGATSLQRSQAFQEHTFR
jgi:hypothetical protein